MKAYTDLEQSKKLAEILPLKSADQTWERIAIAGANLDVPEELQYRLNGDSPYLYYSGIGIPCWSLSALLNVINKDFYPNLFHDGEAWNLTATHHDDNTIKYDTCGDDPLDIIYRMIVFLHDQNLI